MTSIRWKSETRDGVWNRIHKIAIVRDRGEILLGCGRDWFQSPLTGKASVEINPSEGEPCRNCFGVEADDEKWNATRWNS